MIPTHQLSNTMVTTDDLANRAPTCPACGRVLEHGEHPGPHLDEDERRAREQAKVPPAPREDDPDTDDLS